MRDEDRLVAHFDGVQRRLIARMRDVDSHAELVHAAHRLTTELRQAAITALLEARSERIGLAVRDAGLTDPESIEHVEAIHLVFNWCGRLERRNQRDLAIGFR